MSGRYIRCSLKLRFQTNIAGQSYATLLPHSEQQHGFPNSRLSHTGQLRPMPILLLPGLTSKISKATIIVIAVPVKKFSRSQLAFSGTPFSVSQFAIKSTFPPRRTAPISPIITIFLIPKLIIYPFKNQSFQFKIAQMDTERKKKLENISKFILLQNNSSQLVQLVLDK